MLIFARFQKYKKNKKNQNLQKKEEKRRKGKVEGLIWKPSKMFPINTMLHWFCKGGAILQLGGGNTKKKTLKAELLLLPHSKEPPPPPSHLFFFYFSSCLATSPGHLHQPGKPSPFPARLSSPLSHGFSPSPRQQLHFSFPATHPNTSHAPDLPPPSGASLSHWEHRLPARSWQIFPPPPAAGHGLPHQHRRDKASPSGGRTPAASNLFVSFNQRRRPVNCLPSPPQLQQSQTTAATRSTIGRKKRRTRIRENRYPWTDLEKKTKTDCFLCVFLVVAGDGDPHRQRRKTGKKKTLPIHWFSVFISSRAASGGGALL